MSAHTPESLADANLNLSFTGKTFLVRYFISRHMLGHREHRLSDKEHDSLSDFLDRLNVDGRWQWVDTTPIGSDGYEGVCAVTGRKSEGLQRMALISWTEAGE